ncbi:MAG: hypothetical protein OEZ14_03885 [Acidimicrobiia bacterium]|nr:hypothetical protein [Acidimicrobiia bacterium]MDH5519657.1 hypothetical protein [Acidimicrobiia bacterium]
MFGWSAQAAGGDRLDAFIDQVSSHRCDAAEELLTCLRRSKELNDEQASRCRDLLHQIRRLARHQERLAEVAADLALDEQRTCAELRLLASSATESRLASQAASTISTIDAPAPVVPAVDRRPSTNTRIHRLQIWLLGSCRLSCDDRDLDGGNGDQAAAVLRYLAWQPVCGAKRITAVVR